MVLIHVCVHTDRARNLPALHSQGAWGMAGGGLVLETRSDIFQLSVLPQRHLLESRDTIHFQRLLLHPNKVLACWNQTWYVVPARGSVTVGCLAYNLQYVYLLGLSVSQCIWSIHVMPRAVLHSWLVLFCSPGACHLPKISN